MIRIGADHYTMKHKNVLAVTRIRTWVASATTKSTNHYTITATEDRWKDVLNNIIYSKVQLIHAQRIFIVYSLSATTNNGSCACTDVIEIGNIYLYD